MRSRNRHPASLSHAMDPAVSNNDMTTSKEARPSSQEDPGDSDTSTILRESPLKQKKKKKKKHWTLFSASGNANNNTKATTTTHHNSSLVNAKKPQRRYLSEQDSAGDEPTVVAAVVRPRAHRSILKGPAATTTNQQQHQQQHQQQQQVTFANVYVREYARTVGDHPCCSSGAPLSLDWHFLPTRTHRLDAFEQQRESQRRCDLILPRHVREHLLKELWGVSQPQIAAAVRAGLKVKNSRRTCVLHANSKAQQRVEQVLDHAMSYTKTKKHNSKKNEQALQQQHLQAQKVQQQERQQALQRWSQQSRPAQAAASCSGGGQRPQRRLTLPHATCLDDNEHGNDSSDDNDCSLLPTQTVSLTTLLHTMKHRSDSDNDDNGPLPSILKHDSTPRPSSLLGRSSSNESLSSLYSSCSEDSTPPRPKGVVFCTHPETNQVWGLIHTIPPAPPLQDHDQLWWSEQELDDRYCQDMDAANLLGDAYGDLLRQAYQSTKANSYDLYWDNDLAADCVLARGLEAEALPELRDLCQVHQRAVLKQQARLRQPPQENDVDSNNMAMDERLQKTSAKYSRPSRLVAQQMGTWDADQVE